MNRELMPEKVLSTNLVGNYTTKAGIYSSFKNIMLQYFYGR